MAFYGLSADNTPTENASKRSLYIALVFIFRCSQDIPVWWQNKQEMQALIAGALDKGHFEMLMDDQLMRMESNKWKKVWNRVFDAEELKLMLEKCWKKYLGGRDGTASTLGKNLSKRQTAVQMGCTHSVVVLSEGCVGGKEPKNHLAHTRVPTSHVAGLTARIHRKILDSWKPPDTRHPVPLGRQTSTHPCSGMRESHTQCTSPTNVSPSVCHHSTLCLAPCVTCVSPCL